MWISCDHVILDIMMMMMMTMMMMMMMMMIKCVLSRQVVACESAAPATNDFLITYCFCSHVLPILVLIPRYCSLITSTTKSFSSWWWCYKSYKVSGIGVSNGEGDGNSGGDDQEHRVMVGRASYSSPPPLSSWCSCPPCLWWGGQLKSLQGNRCNHYRVPNAAIASWCQ